MLRNILKRNDNVPSKSDELKENENAMIATSLSIPTDRCIAQSTPISSTYISSPSDSTFKNNISHILKSNKSIKSDISTTETTSLGSKYILKETKNITPPTTPPRKAENSGKTKESFDKPLPTVPPIENKKKEEVKETKSVESATKKESKKEAPHKKEKAKKRISLSPKFNETVRIGEGGQYSIVSHLNTKPSDWCIKEKSKNDSPTFINPFLRDEVTRRSSLIDTSAHPSLVKNLPRIAPFTKKLNEVLENDLFNEIPGEKSPINVTMASVLQNGFPLLQTLNYNSLLESDPRVIVFLGSSFNSDLTSALKSRTNNHSLIVSKTIPVKIDNKDKLEMNIINRELDMIGKMYTVASSSLYGRFGNPPKVICLPEEYKNAEEYWETIRQNAWENMPIEEKATYLSYNDKFDTSNIATLADEKSVLYQSLFESFVLFVFKITDITIKDTVLSKNVSILENEESDEKISQYAWSSNLIVPHESIMDTLKRNSELIKKESYSFTLPESVKENPTNEDFWKI